MSEPGVPGAGEGGGRHGGDDAQEQIEGSGHLLARGPVGQNLQGPGKQVVLRGERLFGAVERGGSGPFATAQQKGEGDGLGVGVGELARRGRSGRAVAASPSPTEGVGGCGGGRALGLPVRRR